VRENSIFNPFIDFKPVKRVKNRSGASEFMTVDDSTSDGVLDLLETINSRLWENVV